MTRAVLMQCPGDPFVTAYWLRNLDRVWRGTVDELDVHVNGQRDPRIVKWIRGEVARLDGRVTFEPGRLIHGQATRILVERATADLLLLIEDDAFVREPGAVAAAFAAIENGETDVVGTPRGGMDPEIEAFARAKWADHDLAAPEPYPVPSSGPGLWPCFVFARRADLMATSRRFESWAWRPGETIPGVGYRVEGREQTTDSFTTTAFELRGAGLRIRPCVQHKELWHRVLPEEGAPWFHAGGLSNGWFLDDGWDGGGARPGIGSSNEGLDWAHRCFWWYRCLDSAGDLFPDLQDRYRARLDALIDMTGVRDQVEAWEETQPQWINWDDQA